MKKRSFRQTMFSFLFIRVRLFLQTRYYLLAPAIHPSVFNFMDGVQNVCQKEKQTHQPNIWPENVICAHCINSNQAMILEKKRKFHFFIEQYCLCAELANFCMEYMKLFGRKSVLLLVPIKRCHSLNDFPAIVFMQSEKCSGIEKPINLMAKKKLKFFCNVTYGLKLQ